MTAARPVTLPRFVDFLREKLGRNWVVARRTSRVLSQYGDDVVTLTAKQFNALKDEYFHKYGLHPHA